MSDYTPTTEVVEANYEYSNWLQRAGGREQYEAEFDRWLAEVKAQARQVERDYITQYFKSEITIAQEWYAKNKEKCTPEDDIRNSTVIAVYENLVKVFADNPYRHGEIDATDTD